MSLDKAFHEGYYVDEESGCWIWEGSLFSNGYGMVASCGDRYLAHRASWELHKGPIPEDMLVLHKNMNGESHRKDCVNPDHLTLGTQKDNMRHAMEAGILRSKLTEADVVEMRRMAREGITVVEIASNFPVSEEATRLAVNGETWRHVDG